MLAAALLGLGPSGSAQADDNVARLARLNYIQYCTGCHLMDGTGAPQRGIPTLRDTLGLFMEVPGGRAYIAQVPGVMNSPLDDRQTAELMNWLLPAMASAGATSQPVARSPYTADEIARLRKTRPADVMRTREELVQRLRQAGHAVDSLYP